AVDRVDTGEDHRLRIGVAGQRIFGRNTCAGDGVADLGLTNVLHSGDQVADLTDAKALRGNRLGAGYADLEQFVVGVRRHHLDPLTRGEVAVDHADVGDDATVRVVHRVEDHGTGRSVCV